MKSEYIKDKPTYVRILSQKS